MYVCFKTNEDLLLPEYFDYYFKSTTFKRKMTKRLEGSVRLCLNYDGLCNIKINLPDLEEQQKISFQLYSLDQKIELETKYLDLLSKQKTVLFTKPVYINKFCSRYFFCCWYCVKICFSVSIFLSMNERKLAIFCCSSKSGT